MVKKCVRKIDIETGMYLNAKKKSLIIEMKYGGWQSEFCFFLYLCKTFETSWTSK